MPRVNIVAPIYDEIFENDPLLLNDDNQLKYGRAMLQHLLVYRLLTTSTPFPLDLHERKDREGFLQRGPATPPDPPDEQLIKRYREIRRNREALNDSEFEQFKDLTMMSDGRLTAQRRNLDYRNHKQAEDNFTKWNALDDFNKRFRFAAIGYRVKISKLAGIGYFGEELSAMRSPPNDAEVPDLGEVPTTPPQLGRTCGFDDERLGHWQETILRHIKLALHRKSKIVLLPEFTLPSSTSKGAPIHQEIRKLSEEKSVGDHFMVAGTRHEERHNRGFVLSKRGSDVAPDWWHYKMASARGLGENVMGSFGKNLPSYKTSMQFVAAEARITVAVCYDTYDPTTFLSIVLEAMSSQIKGKPKIILVPSFNPADDFVALLRDLSFLARCIVIYVNGLHGDARMFVCGYALADFANKLPLIRRTIQEEEVRLKKVIEDKNKAAEASKTERGWARPRSVASDETTKLEILGRLEERLRLYELDHSIDHIITIEHCEKCETAEHEDGDQHCLRDVLYYNIDVNLINALLEFRREFYLGEDFLPEPLRMSKLEDALEVLEKRDAA
jgi:hypothetical protein